MSCFNFIIMKVNGADVSNLPYEEAVQLFLNAEEPILVEVRRRCFDETNKLSFFNYDTHKSPTLAVIASSNPPNFRDEVDFCGLSEEANSSLKTLKDSSDKKPAISTTSCQTDLSAFDSESKEILFMKEEEATDNGTFFRRKQEPATTSVNTIDGCLRTEFDIEEITLRKSQSTENLGFTISYSTEDYSGTESGSDESNDGDDRHEGEFDFSDFNAAHGCKIYVSDIVPNSLADRDGRLHQGDRILQINGQNVLEKVDPNKLLMENKHSVTILVSRYAYTGEDDFLDSAVYCDDKECQDDRHLASICECEQNTFSSKSSLSQPDPNSCAAITDSTTFPILPIAVEKVSELFSHANIKSQLESVNKEISLLNSQISIMKLQQCQMEHQATTDKDTTLLKWKEKPTQSTKIKTPERQIKQKPAEPEVEHIYETIPEDTESDAYYCSPYEGVNDLRVEQWLTSIGCTKSHIQRIHFGAAGDKAQTDTTGPNPAPSRLPKHNPILDDYDNSSSAYNTGGSCNSALLALDQQSKPTLSNQVDRRHSRKLSAKCKNTFHVLNRLNNTESKNTECPSASIHYQQTSEKPRLSTCIGGQTPVPSTPVPVTNPCHTDAESDGHSTLVARSSVCRRYQYKTIDENKDESTAETVWKVKRRPDGTRYIVRRVTRKQPVMESASEQAHSQDSTTYTDYKRQAQKVKDRRHRHRNAPTPSKEKHHAQHWLV